VSSEILAAELVGAQQHGPGGAAHVVVLAAVVVIALAFFGVNRWRRSHAAKAAEQKSTSDDPSAEVTRTTKEK